MSVGTQAFFWFPFVWNTFLHHLTFSLYASLDLKWVSCGWGIKGSYFCIHSASLRLLAGVFNPFTFKVIIDMCVLIAIWICFCRLFLNQLSLSLKNKDYFVCHWGLFSKLKFTLSKQSTFFKNVNKCLIIPFVYG